MIASTANARAGLSELLASIHNAASQALRTAEETSREHAKRTTLWKDKSGETRKSIHGEVYGLRGFVEAGGAARWLEFGTPPHVISGSKGKQLRFAIAGSTLFRSRVHHQGTAERPFMQQARDQGQKVLEYGLAYFVGYAIQQANKSR